jgi:DNA-binding CsgD family transcriptional regulator
MLERSNPDAGPTPEIDHEALLGLIGRIYDAALDPTLWPEALAGVAAFVPGLSASLFSKDATNKSGGIFYDDGALEPHYKQLYFEKHIKTDPFNSAHVFADSADLLSTADIIPLAEFYRSPFYIGWARPQGLVDFICATIDKSATGATLFGVFRHECHGPVDDDARRRMRLLVPHMRRAIAIANEVGSKSARAANCTGALDAMNAGIFLIDARGNLVHANDTGETMLAAGDVLRAIAGRLVANDARMSQALNDLVSNAGTADAAPGAKGIAMPLASRSGVSFVAHLLPLAFGARQQAGGHLSAVAALFVRKAELELRSPLEIAAKVYKLTPAELRVLLALVEIGGVPEVARALGIAETTVKFHLQRLFAKTGASRQAELVKLVAGFSSPLG